MKTCLKDSLLLGALMACLAWIAVARATAQTFSTLHTFSQGVDANWDGVFPSALLVSGNVVYGITRGGGTLGQGVLFRVSIDGSGFTNLHNFSESGDAFAGLVLQSHTLYGTRSSYGNSTDTVFKVDIDGTGFATLHTFAAPVDGGAGQDTNTNGAYPSGFALLGNTLYGTANAGGDFGRDTLFKLNTDGTGFGTLHTFFEAAYDCCGALTNADGAYLHGLISQDATLYGYASYGGRSGNGTLFKVNTDGTGFATLHAFSVTVTNAAGSLTNSDGANPTALALLGNMLYGTTSGGGSAGHGTLFRLNTNGTEFVTLLNFGGTTILSHGGLIALGGKLYGMTEFAYFDGINHHGTLFSVNADGSAFTVLHNLTDGEDPSSDGPLTASDGTLLWGASGGILGINTNGTGLTVLHNFSPTRPVNDDGTGPNGVIFADGVLYGTMTGGGDLGGGTVFSININGSNFRTLHTFSGDSLTAGLLTNRGGAFPLSRLVLYGSTLYGTTGEGGDSGQGTVFKVNTDGTGFSTLHSFSVGEGGYPSGLVLTNNTLYGTLFNGYAVFAINTDGSQFRTLHRFGGGDGGNPIELVLAGSTLYGCASGGGQFGSGTLFSLNTDGTGFRILHNFSDGEPPIGHLILSGDLLFGTTVTNIGSDPYPGAIFKIKTDGTGFRNLRGGIDYLSSLSILSGNTLYGAATWTGWPTPPYGEIFALNTDGTSFTTLFSFPREENNSIIDGLPHPNLILSGNTFYGTTFHSAYFTTQGEVFSLSVAPQLAITTSRTNITLTWPTNYAGFDYTGYRLQTTTDLISPTVWTNVSPDPVVNDGLNTVPNPMSGAQRFYRLVR